MDYLAYRDRAWREAPENADAVAAFGLLEGWFGGVAPDRMKEAMSAYHVHLDSFSIADIRRWESLGLDMGDCPRLMEVAAKEYSIGRVVYENYYFKPKAPWARLVVVHLIKRGLRLPPTHGVELRWIETILLILAASGKARGGPLSQFPRDMARGLAEFIRD